MLRQILQQFRLKDGTRRDRPRRDVPPSWRASEALESRCLLSAVTVQLSASDDTTIYEADAQASNGAGEFLLSGGGTRGLVRFDLSDAGIPDGSTIIDAVLTLNVGAATSDAVGVSVHRVTTAWGEAGSNAPGDETSGAPAQPFDATWQFSTYGGSSWNNAGGDFAAASAATTVGGPGSYEWIGGALIDDVQYWLDDAAVNFGWLLNGGASEAIKAFVSKDGPDAALAPTLEITYEEPPAPPRFVEGRLWNDINGDGIQTDLLISQLQLSIVADNTHFDGFGGREHWFRSSTNNRWYYLTEDGTLTQWSGKKNSLTGNVAGQVDPRFWLQPALVETSRGTPEPWLNGWTVELVDASGSVVQTTRTQPIDMNGDGAVDTTLEGGWYRFQVSDDAQYTVRQVIPDGWAETVRLTIDGATGGQQGVGNLDLRFHTSWYENAAGAGEKWIRDENTRLWYYILPSGDLYRWNGRRFSDSEPLNGTWVGHPGTAYHADPTLLAGYNPSTGTNPVSDLRTDFGNRVSQTIRGRVWLDFYNNGTRDLHTESRELTPADPIGEDEAWFFDASRSAWFIIDGGGHARYWGQHSDAAMVASGTDSASVLTVEPWLNGRTVQLVDVHGTVVATTETRSIDLNQNGTIEFETERGWYVFEGVPEGEYRLQTVEDSKWLQTAPVGGADNLAATLKQQLGLRSTSSDFQNWGGLNERWILDRDNRWYYILTDGSLYRWEIGSNQHNGGLRGTLLATLTPDHYLNLDRLTDPDVSAARVVVGPGGTLTEIAFGNHELLDALNVL